MRRLVVVALVATQVATPVAWSSPVAAPVRSSPGSSPGPVQEAGRTVRAPQVSLDEWIVSRYRDAQLLPDSAVAPSRAPSRASGPAPATTPGAADPPYPRVESVRGGTVVDTLFAVHFGARESVPAMPRDAGVRLAGPTGTITPLAARVIGRRAFRAPRAASSISGRGAQWRYGWGYVVLLPRRGRESPAIAYRGWLLF